MVDSTDQKLADLLVKMLAEKMGFLMESKMVSKLVKLKVETWVALLDN